MGNKLSQQIKEQCQEYKIKESEILEIIKFLKSKRYNCRSLIGKGSFGVVLSVYSEKFKKDVAIKCILIDPDQKIERIQREVDLQQKFKNNNLFLHIYETFQQNVSMLYIVTELCDGSLRNLIAKGNYDQDDANSITLQLLLAFKEMSNKSIIHFDIRPENILYVKNEEGYIVKIADFGLAKALSKQNLDSLYTEKANVTQTLLIFLQQKQFIRLQVQVIQHMQVLKYSKNNLPLLQKLDFLIIEQLYQRISYQMLKVDIYSLGVVFIEIFSKQSLQVSCDLDIKYGNLDDFLKKQQVQFEDIYIKLIKNMVVQYDKRLNAKELIELLMEKEQFSKLYDGDKLKIDDINELALLAEQYQIMMF